MTDVSLGKRCQCDGWQVRRVVPAFRSGDDGTGSFQLHNQYTPSVGFVMYDEKAQAIETDRRKTVRRWNDLLGVNLASLDGGLPVFAVLF